jgi:thiamine-phosphate diphosphorylase/hydroxyethylthiazole kinase
VLLTGPVDYLSDGTCTLAIYNGHPLLGKITGSGCALGSTVASYLAVHKKYKLLAVLAAILHYEIAAQAGEKCDDTWLSDMAKVEFIGP